MGYLKINIVAVLLIVLFSSCNDFEMRGFVTSHQSANERFEESDAWNQQNGFTVLNVPHENYIIYSMGDSHVGGTENLDTFFGEAKNNNATAVLMVGDITTGHEEDYNVLEQHLPQKSDLNYFAVAGNHDLYFNGWQHFYSIFGSSSYYFVVNTPTHSDLFIGLETGAGTLGSTQLDWFKKLLGNNREDFRYCTIFTHNNLFRMRQTATTNPMAEEIQALIDLFIRHNVNMVITAHDHKRNTKILGNTTHIIMDALEDTNEEAGYLRLSFSENGIDYNFTELGE